MTQKKRRNRRGNRRKKQRLSLPALIAACLILIFYDKLPLDSRNGAVYLSDPIESVEEVPEYDGDPYVYINNNIPEFPQEEKTEVSFESYSDLDRLGRCQTACANIGSDLMPEGERESISQVKPTGWIQAQYNFVDGESLYNRCHLIGYQLTGENANEKNLITGTRYMNVEGMLPFENMVAEYIDETDNHVLYQVTPVFEEDELVARGVEMEGYSVEDEGQGISFHVFVYNVEPGVEIDYETGESALAGSEP
ncbi:MAG TPA: DNA/RNA non-specific endonuclease [Candidatus Blautia faecipullorum]|nr:DNA/RNA non-specific endonuclease [Candidatus Blautia faecipullorum]